MKKHRILLRLLPVAKAERPGLRKTKADKKVNKERRRVRHNAFFFFFFFFLLCSSSRLLKCGDEDHVCTIVPLESLQIQ